MRFGNFRIRLGKILRQRQDSGFVRVAREQRVQLQESIADMFRVGRKRSFKMRLGVGKSRLIHEQRSHDLPRLRRFGVRLQPNACRFQRDSHIPRVPCDFGRALSDPRVEGLAGQFEV